MIAVQISVLHWVTQTDSMGCLKLATLTVSKYTVVPCLLIEHAQWIFPLSGRICKWCTSQLEESNAKRIKGQFNNKSNTTIRSCFQMYFLFPLRDRRLVNWILWWIGNQYQMCSCLPPTARWERLQPLPMTLNMAKKTQKKRSVILSLHWWWCCQGVRNLGTWCAFLSDILHTAVCALKNKLHHYIPSHCALHIPSALYWRIPYVCSMYMYTTTSLSSETAYPQRFFAFSPVLT